MFFMCVFNNSLVQLTQGAVVTYMLCALLMSEVLTMAFCSACTASQLSSPCPLAYSDPAHGKSTQCGCPRAGPLYPVPSTWSDCEVMTAPTARLEHVALHAQTSAMVIAISCTLGLDKVEVPLIHVQVLDLPDNTSCVTF
jgi:hypothetical protein